MRLIDADEFKDYIIDNLEGYKLLTDEYRDFARDIIRGFLKDIDAQPTAYDIDKVVKQLSNLDVGTSFCSQCKYANAKECETIADEMLKKHELNDRVDLCAMLMKTKAIEIVKVE